MCSTPAISLNLFDYKLPANLYRRFLIMTDAWEGTRANPGSLLIRSHEGGEGLPFFWCGWPDNLPSFHQVFEKERSIYCICGTFAVVKPSDENICALATYYAAEIIKIQPQGPYLLGGFCEAALIAYEIAKILHAQQYEIGALILVERDVTAYDFPLKLANKCFKTFDTLVERFFELREAPLKCIQDILSNKRAQLTVRIKALKAKLGIIKAEANPASYQLTPYSGAVTLIFIKWGELGYYRFQFFRRYWQKLATGGAQFYIVDSYTHHNPNNWPKIANTIRTHLSALGF